MQMNISIPLEIITEILYRLPEKSVSLFSSVSKEWLSLISDPKFIKTYKKKHNQNHIIFLSDNDDFLYSHPFHHHETLITPTEFSSVNDYGETFQFGGSCDGFVLLYVSGSYPDYMVLLRNLTTIETVQVPNSYGNIVGFGYDTLTNDYKVVTISKFTYDYLSTISKFTYGYWPPNDISVVQVYSHKTNTWRRAVNLPPQYFFDYFSNGKDGGVFVSGFIHWIAEKNSKRVIVAFSLADEKFSEVPSPNLSSKKDFRLFVFGKKLAIYLESEVWVMNKYGKMESWTKTLLHGFDQIQMDKPMVYDINGDLLVADKDKMLIYDVEKRSFNEIVYVWNPKNLKVAGTWVCPKFGINN